MKKSTIGLACVCMYLLAASCQIPEAVTLRGSPGVHLPLGSPFDLMDTRLEEYINSGKIMEMMSGGDDNVKIYEYTGESVEDGVEAYIILYPITEMELDLQKYIDNSTEDEEGEFNARIPINVTNPPGGNFPQYGYHITRDSNNTVVEREVGNEATDDVVPLFTIDLPDMVKLVKEVIGGPFGLELELELGVGFDQSLWIKIPELGITNYIQGERAGDKLRFVNNTPSATLYPQDWETQEITIYVIAKEPCSGIIEPKMVFEWEEAIIDASNNPIRNTYTIDNTDLNGFFGGGINFKEAKGYVYAGGVGVASMSLKKAGASNNLAGGQLTNTNHPSFSNRFNEKIPQHSLEQDEFIDLTDTLNASITGEIKLEYALSIQERRVTREDLLEKDTIFADLVILLPMEFTTNIPPGDTPYASNYADYAKLDLNDLFPNMGKEDLFQRKGNNDDLFKALKTVKFILSNVQNDILGGKIYILVGAGNDAGLLDLQMPNPSVEFDVSNLPPPFIPQFEILIERDTPGGDASFWLKRKNPGNNNVTFDFFLAIQARTDIDQTISIPRM